MTGWTEAPDEVARQLDEMSLALMTLQETVEALTARVAALEAQPQTGPARPVVIASVKVPLKGQNALQRHQLVMQIAERVAAEAGIDASAIIGKSREQFISELRQRVMYDASMAGIGLNAIGRSLGGRDHSTVAHGVKAHTERMKGTQ